MCGVATGKADIARQKIQPVIKVIKQTHTCLQGLKPGTHAAHAASLEGSLRMHAGAGCCERQGQSMRTEHSA